MDWMSIGGKGLDLLKKYRYVLLVLLVGLILMAVPEQDREAPKVDSFETEAVQTDPSQRLEEILCQIQGAGKVEVLLTCATREETIYQTDEDDSVSSDSSSIRRETVIITDGDRVENGLVRTVNPPTYLGAVVVCQGADSPSVKLAIVEAVANATGLGTDRITVLKMK